MVASRCPQRFFLAAFISRSTSASVRYSRVRSLLFGRRLGVTVRFTVAGVTSLRCLLAMRFALVTITTVRIMVVLRTVCNSVFVDLSRRVPFPRERCGNVPHPLFQKHGVKPSLVLDVRCVFTDSRQQTASDWQAPLRVLFFTLLSQKSPPPLLQKDRVK